MTVIRVGLTALALSALFSTSAFAVKVSHSELSNTVRVYGAAQADVIGSTIISTAQRLARLNGASSSDLTNGEVLGYMAAFAPNTAAGAAVAMQAAGSAFKPFDVWVDGSFAVIETQVATSRATIGSAGVDYVVDQNLLVGGFVSVDRLLESKSAWQNAEGTGVMVGPYMTARLSEELTLDVTAAVGLAQYKSIEGTDEVLNNSRRAYFNATVSGNFGDAALRFTPRAGLSYAGEWTNGYDIGYGIENRNDYGTTTVFAGPGLTYSANRDGLAYTASVNADVKSTLGDNAVLSGAVEAALKVNLDNGLGFGAAAHYSGIGTSNRATTISLKASAGF
jgi:hypothetical protein